MTLRLHGKWLFASLLVTNFVLSLPTGNLGWELGLNRVSSRELSKLLYEQLKIDNIFKLQSTLVISKSKGPSQTLRDIRTSTYQMCRIEENTDRTTKFHK